MSFAGTLMLSWPYLIVLHKSKLDVKQPLMTWLSLIVENYVLITNGDELYLLVLIFHIPNYTKITCLWMFGGYGY
jgi:hypothetical protein